MLVFIKYYFYFNKLAKYKIFQVKLNLTNEFLEIAANLPLSIQSTLLLISQDFLNEQFHFLKENTKPIITLHETLLR